MAKLITEANAYGQLELNQVAFRRDGRIEAQCRLDDTINGYVENGMILAIDPVNHTVKYPKADGTDENLALNYTTEHRYDERNIGLKTFKLDKDTFLPRLGYLAKGDKFTTNTVTYDDGEDALATLKAAIKEGKAYGLPSTTGYIAVTVSETKPSKAIVKAIEFTTMPDGSDAIKFIAL